MNNLHRLLNPKTIAFFGGSNASEAIYQCQSIGFKGDIWPVNPQRKTLRGLKCFKSANDLPSPPDASFIATPPNATIEIINDLKKKGAGGAVCFASGFAELNVEGAKLQEQLQNVAGNMPVIGPNCHGFLNYMDNVALWPDQHGGENVKGGIALITQSGNFGINLSMQKRGLDIAYIITIGNKACLDLNNYINFLINDPRISAIGIHLESINNIHEFSISAIKALKAGKPIVVIKTGQSEQGAAINLSHTASLAGEDRLYSALFDRLGIVRCQSISQFLETLKFLSIVGTLNSNRLGSMSCSGGEASLIADYADIADLKLPKLTKKTKQHLGEILGPKVPLSNPLDYHTYAWGNHEKLLGCFSAMLENKFDCTILVLDYSSKVSDDAINWKIAENALCEASNKTNQQAVIVSTLPETMPSHVRDRLKRNGIAPMQGLDDCLFAIKMAAKIGNRKKQINQLLPVLKPKKLSGKKNMLNEWESKKKLQSAGLSIPKGEVCLPNEAAAVAEKIGFPVVLKGLSDSVVHKSEIGAVFIGIMNKESVISASNQLAENFQEILVEKMIESNVAEIIVGINRDQTFGLNLLIGAGGTLVELLDDTVSLLLPTNKNDIINAIKSLKIFNIIQGFRGEIPGDFNAIVEAIENIANFAINNHENLIELDVNPLIVLPKGTIAVDAVIQECK